MTISIPQLEGYCLQQKGVYNFMQLFKIIILSYLFTACGDLSSEQKDEIGAKINPETKTTNLDDEDGEPIAECQTPDPIVQIVEKEVEVVVEVPLADNQWFDAIADKLWIKGGSTTIAQAQLACSDGYRLPTPSELQLAISRGLRHASASHLWTNLDEGVSPHNGKHYWRAVTQADAGLSSGHTTNVFGVLCVEE